MSRSTFRRIVRGENAWQKQLRDRYLAEGVPPVPHLDVGRAEVRPVSYAFAETVIHKYEWLGTMAKTTTHFGLFFGPFCAGVTCFATNGTGTAGVHRHEEFGIGQRDLATLARGACVHWAPPGSNSRLVSISCRLVAKARLAKLVIAYSDSDAGEIGTIYQACGWTFVGYTKRQVDLVAPNGRAYNRRILGEVAAKNAVSTGRARRALLDEGWTEQLSNRKGKYVLVLDRKDAALVARVASMRQPYPKREDLFADAGEAEEPSSGSSGAAD